MTNAIRSGLAWAAIGLCAAATAGRGQQVIERDTKLTGPRGRTIERDIRVERGPGYIDRRVEIKRPGETLVRDTRIANPGGRPFAGPGYGHGPGPRFYGGRPIVEEVIVPRPPLFSTFVGVPGFSLFLGGPPPPPPPVVVYPEPGVVFYPEPTVVYPPPIVAAPPVALPPPQVAIDPLTEPLSRLKSLHSNSRRDGCLALGSLDDDRAVPSLIERLEHDLEREVRVAAAWALGEIGDPRAAVPLERAALYDKRHDVRDAAKTAYARLAKPGQPLPASVPGPAQSRSPARYQAPAPVVSRPEVYDPGPGATPRAADPGDTPPPPPSPAGGPGLR